MAEPKEESTYEDLKVKIKKMFQLNSSKASLFSEEEDVVKVEDAANLTLAVMKSSIMEDVEATMALKESQKQRLLAEKSLSIALLVLLLANIVMGLIK